MREAESWRPSAFCWSAPGCGTRVAGDRAASDRCEEVGVVCLNNRHHDPTLGQFISVDPLVTQTSEPYIYASGNPITWSDPSGLETCRLDENNQPTVCFDDFEFYVTQVALAVGQQTIQEYDQVRVENGFVPTIDQTWLDLRAINEQLQTQLNTFYPPDEPVDVVDLAKNVGKNVVVGGGSAAAGAKWCPGYWKIACAAAFGTVANYEPHRVVRRLDPLGGLGHDRSATTGEVSRRAA
ncbi:MAG: RHS repeat-associated core domain-containing protein [Ilumatobacter sp.]|uniref:RHS repeat-associated core domain-containing protein n=1 Tax=Ilumatobacter sp. TaxID=1967498 RepID=UPI002629082A|nr:RHS repeat-associated core domain-containing protein [Ilumatobacter sp.]MDJ0770486.1 RHS repeat-associated core domain-containing protein [Ilumatobacter sp.]